MAEQTITLDLLAYSCKFPDTMCLKLYDEFMACKLLTTVARNVTTPRAVWRLHAYFDTYGASCSAQRRRKTCNTA